MAPSNDIQLEVLCLLDFMTRGDRSLESACPYIVNMRKYGYIRIEQKPPRRYPLPQDLLAEIPQTVA